MSRVSITALAALGMPAGETPALISTCCLFVFVFLLQVARGQCGRPRRYARNAAAYDRKCKGVKDVRDGLPDGGTPIIIESGGPMPQVYFGVYFEPASRQSKYTLATVLYTVVY